MVVPARPAARCAADRSARPAWGWATVSADPPADADVIGARRGEGEGQIGVVVSGARVARARVVVGQHGARAVDQFEMLSVAMLLPSMSKMAVAPAAVTSTR